MAPVFEYQARSKSGKKVNGTISADEPSLVASQLKEQGYYVTSVDQKAEKKDVAEYFSFLNRVTISDLAVFSQQFSVLINAGISLVDAIELLNDQTNNKKLKEVLREVQEEVETGSSLSEAFKNHSDVFPPLYYQLIKAGEAGGRLDTVLANLAERYERQEELKNKVKSAMYYPVVVLIIAVLAVIGMLMFIVPQFVGMFADMGAELPLPTRILLMLSNFLQNYWWFLGGILAVIIFALLQYNKTAIGKLFFDSLKLKIPSMGILFKKIAISRFSGTLSMLLNSGVDLLAGLGIVEEVVGNDVYTQFITESRIKVRDGESLSASIEKDDLFPNMVVHMVRIGEETGQIDQLLQKVTDFYDREVESAVEGSISMIEPLMIVMLAIVVGSAVIAIVLPMFDMFQHIQ